jgi:hypothetical protein
LYIYFIFAYIQIITIIMTIMNNMINKKNYKNYFEELSNLGLPNDVILYIIHIALYGFNYSKILKSNKIEWKNRMHNFL